MNTNLPLQGIIVLEFSQFLAGPSAGLRLADLGARVIKIERPKAGDACRKLAFKNMFVGDDSLLFHTINRNKESFEADLKNPQDLLLVKKLIQKAHIITHNFRPGVMEKIGLDYDSVKLINQKIIYAQVSGYGKIGPWKDKPGQDLLVQALSGLAFLSGNDKATLTPFGLSIADMMCGAHLVQGILAGLLLEQQTGVGSYIEVSLLESVLDFQFEFLTTWFSNGGKLPQRSKINNANCLLAAPYGIYQTSDGYIAIAMCDLKTFFSAIDFITTAEYSVEDAFDKRDEIKDKISQKLITDTTHVWISKLDKYKIWSMPVLDWAQLCNTKTYQSLDWQQLITTGSGDKIHLTRGAIRLDNQILSTNKAAPLLGEHTRQIRKEFID